MQLKATILFGLGVHSIFFFTFLIDLHIHLFFSFSIDLLVNLFLEWSLATQFSANDEFLKKWADAQKFVYGKGAGWFVSHLFFFFFYLLPSS